jgi:transposase InsO family protein
MQRSLKANSITQSMSRKGECHDNAVAENFFNTLKTELISQQTYQNPFGFFFLKKKGDAVSPLFLA